MENQTPEQIAQHFKAMGDSVWIINTVITGKQVAGLTHTAKKDSVKRNVEHLELMKTKDFWTNEDFTAIDAAIAAGKSYLEAD